MKGARGRLVCVNMVTPDPKRLADFYQEVLGASIEESHGGPDRIEIWLGPANDSTVCLVANRQEGYVPPEYHTCQGFELRVEDAEREYARICRMGIAASSLQDVPWGYRFFHIKDPDGNGIDLVQGL